MQFRVKIRHQGAPDEVRIINAATRFEVYEDVRKAGGTVVALTEKGVGFDLQKLLHLSIGVGVKQREIMVMAKNLSAMLSAGLSLARALSVIERQSSGRKLREVTHAVSESLTKGSSLHEALAKYPKVFSPLFIAMVRTGEESGSLAESLAIVGTQMEKSQALIRKIRGAMIYPIIVITAIIIVAVLMLIFVVPTLTSTFTSLGVELPLSTRIIVALSNFMSAHAILVLTGLVAFIGGFFVFVRSPRGSAIVLRTALVTPAIKDLVRETYAARAARTLSSLLSAGVPVLSALEITQDVVGARLFSSVLEEAQAYVKRGEPLSKAFIEHPKLYPLLLSDMLSVGEETGKEAEMLKNVSLFYEEEVEQKTKDLSTIVEPVLMLFIGTFVGIFAVSMIAPIYSLSSAI